MCVSYSDSKIYTFIFAFSMIYMYSRIYTIITTFKNLEQIMLLVYHFRADIVLTNKFMSDRKNLFLCGNFGCK